MTFQCTWCIDECTGGKRWITADNSQQAAERFAAIVRACDFRFVRLMVNVTVPETPDIKPEVFVVYATQSVTFTSQRL